MDQRLSITAFGLLTLTCLCLGCGSEYPSVSGKVTYDGEPIANIRVVFSPISDSDPGPFSVAVTDDEGAFSMETRYGQSGAVVGPHKVGFDWSDIRSYTMRDLKRNFQESKGNPEKQAKITAKIAEVEQKLASRPKLKPALETDFKVPKSGADDILFELTDF